MSRSEKKHKLSYLIAAFLLILAWSVISHLLNSPAVPSPYLVFLSFIQQLERDLITHFLISAYRVVYSILLALSLAIPIGLTTHEKVVDSFVAPFIYLLYPIPHIVFLPLIVIFFGIGDLSKIILIAMIVFFQVLVTTRDAARSVNDYYIYSLLSLGANKKDVYIHVIFPFALPKIITAMRIGIGTSIAVLFFAESFATTKGLGYLIMDSWSRANYPSLYAGIVSMAILGFILYLILELVERRVCKWM